MIDLAVHSGRGVFVLGRTSNPEGEWLQRADSGAGRSVAQRVIDEISQLNTGVDPMGDVGVVVGATVGAGEVDLTKINGPILVPGLGAQGGRPSDLPAVLGNAAGAVLASYSRQVLRGGPTITGLRASIDRAASECGRVLMITK
jgi:orotidine-5'-phosphate decarboxylase